MTDGMNRRMALMLVVATVLGLWAAACSAQESAQPTEIQVRDKVTVADCRPFGSQCKGGAQYLKKPVVLNFEGLLHRRILTGEIYAEGIRSYGRKLLDPATRKWYVGADITVLSGAARGQKRKIKAIETRKGSPTFGKEETTSPSIVTFSYLTSR